jgi:hypothetical protein
MEFGAALPDDDVAGQRQLATKQLDAQALRLRVTTVAATAARFFVCHDFNPSMIPPRRREALAAADDAADAQLGIGLPVALGLAVMLAAPELDDADFRTAPLGFDGGVTRAPST